MGRIEDGGCYDLRGVRCCGLERDGLAAEVDAARIGARLQGDDIAVLRGVNRILYGVCLEGLCR